MIRAARLAPLVVAFAFVPCVAFADAPAPSTSASASVAVAFASVPVDLASLPSGVLLDIDRENQPSALSAGLKVDGVNVKIEDGGGTPKTHYAQIMSNEEAKAQADHRPRRGQDGLGQMCFDIARPLPRGER